MTLSFDDVADILAAIDTYSGDNMAIEIAGGTLTIARWRTDAVAAETSDAVAAAASEIVFAPTLGFIHYSPEPGAPPFASLGSRVVSGQTLCTIDVLKRLTTVSATSPGRIAEIGADDGTFVEYGQSLFTIHRDA